MTTKIITGDCRDVLRTMTEESVHCCVTSPPYFGLRDYGVDGQIGLEKTVSEFVAELVGVFREVRRVLRDDGTLWLNLGDSYANALHASPIGCNKRYTGMKPKDLIGIPWRVAFALQEDGWYLRQDIIWAKPNPMPESVRDRCTKSHEYIFLLAKSERYYFDQTAIAEESKYWPGQAGIFERTGPVSSHVIPGQSAAQHRKVRSGRRKDELSPARKRNGEDGNAASFRAIQDTRNKRSVWTVATQPFSEAHFATFPPDLIEPCILAGCPKGGEVLDPFGGAGTTGLVADRHGRNATLIELNPTYADMARHRIKGDCPMFVETS